MFILFLSGLSELSGLSSVQYNTLNTTGMAYVREPVSFQINMQQKDNVSGKIDGIVPRSCALSDLEKSSVVCVSGLCYQRVLDTQKIFNEPI
jgi:hypothetical protein|tara:strand:- start:116 stop:391 length:276 start_codon:yes stop_codon:yes gene_type:complete